MSEPVTNAEIEDVLSSIRKLVSESATLDDEGSEPTASSEKLVLTPAFRVNETPEVEEVASEEDAETDHEDQGEVHEGVPSETSEEHRGDDWSDGHHVPQDEGENEDHDHEAHHDQNEHQTDQHEAEEDSADVPSHEDSLEDRIAELEAAVNDVEGDWEPDGSEDEVDTPQTVVFEHAAWAGAPEEVEDAIDLDTQTEADPQDYADDLETDTSQPEASAWPYIAAENDFEDEADEAVIDEDALRELVARLVREELQGSIGERITRNVRRLVRREIQRALTLKDFE
ncbi:hypothetical protein [Aliiroseovarius subalbicans]|uniref:hypothetical protein n=1 Tax=Aliiroseovarius subalbicans TaxID=2925840 RepID=UPI001F57677A|nr:hypothetical protein [Aliiroseovarius subalbicans]MCI2399057.1 hypothetical protein [Aliiroseovarius subalbicans]